MLSHVIAFVLLGLVQIATAFWGGVMSAKAPPPPKSKIRHCGIFLGVAGFGLAIWVGLQSYDVEKGALAAQGRAEQAQQATQGKLDDTAKLKQAESQRALTETKHAGVEAKRLSNQELYDATMDAVRRLRDFGKKEELQSADLSNTVLAKQRAAKTDAERQKVFEEETRAMSIAYYQREAEFRTSILPDAVYVRNELLRRKIPEPLPSPLGGPLIVQMVFSGHLAGPNPEYGAADYLEQMAKQLRLNEP